MPDTEVVLLNCYNRGCGQKFDPLNNAKDECRHHPGLPFFHDAYKGWSCCNKKCIDFTEFLNIPGCTLAKHTNEKPPEPPKPIVDKETAKDVIEVKIRDPVRPSALKRPSFDTALVKIEPTISESLKNQINEVKLELESAVARGENIVTIGTACKNGGCTTSYEGPQTNDTPCVHHPGCPIFHEGMKYWSCCQKKTTSFETFLSQVGCTSGNHKWKKEIQAAGSVMCRWDWHQTGTHVVVSIYAKQYHPTFSFVKLNQIRLCLQLVFPTQGNATFSMDAELRGIIDLSESKVQMNPSKVEIVLRKAEAGSWSNLDFPRKPASTDAPKPVELEVLADSSDDEVDLSSVQPLPSIGSVNISEVVD